MDVLQAIKQRKAIRRYKNKPVPVDLIEKIIDAGIWGPSVPSFLRIQPWMFFVIRDKNKILKIVDILLKKSNISSISISVLLKSACRIISQSPVIILVYKTDEFKKVEEKFSLVYKSYKNIIKYAELSSVSAAIQNMILEAENVGLGTCWLDTPLFCEKKINALVGSKKKLIAVLTLGYADEPGNRSPRKEKSESVVYLNEE